jgi:hypothetical protein
MPKGYLRISGLVCLWVFSLGTSCYGWTPVETESFAFSLNSYLRQDVVTFKNIVDLDSRNSDDTTTYFGVDYSLGLKSEFKDINTSFFVKLERNGPYDYDAPLFIHNTLMTSGGVIEKYRNEELLPELEEFWLDTALVRPYHFKIGLYAYEVGYGFSLNGGYENYGCTFSRETDSCDFRLYYCRPDVDNKNHLGPRIRQDEEQGISYNHGVANFFATDAKFKCADNFLWPYLGVLADYTSSGKRDNVFSAPIKRDILGTAGLACSLKGGNFIWSLELAHNFGSAKSEDEQFKDIEHSGYLVYAGLDYQAGKFTHYLKFLLGSGNKVTPGMAQDGDVNLTSGKNRAFSCYSPTNGNFLDSVSNSNTDMLPIVAMGGGWGLNYGVQRPGNFAAGDFDNLIMPSLGFDFALSKKAVIGLYAYYLRSFNRGAGTLGGEGKYLSADLGYEGDLFIDYKLNSFATLGFLGGYFFPGRYYREERDDTTGSLFSPYLRGDTQANSAYQLELSLTLQF